MSKLIFSLIHKFYILFTQILQDIYKKMGAAAALRKSLGRPCGKIKKADIKSALT